MRKMTSSCGTKKYSITCLQGARMTVTTLLFVSSKKSGPMIPPSQKPLQRPTFCGKNDFSKIT